VPEPAHPQPRKRLPLYLQVLAGVILGCIVGSVFKEAPIVSFSTITTKDLGLLGMLVIRLLKTLAAPLILFAILDAFVKTSISGRDGLRLILICAMNLAVAFTIGLTIMNVLHPGRLWSDHLETLKLEVVTQQARTPSHPEVTLNPIENLAGYIPESLVEPFASNNVATIVLCGLLGGAALRRARARQLEEQRHSVQVLEAFIEAALEVLIMMLEWVVKVVPLAVFGLVAQVVGATGLHIFAILGVFLATILLGLSIHGLIYYPLLAYFVGGKTPRVYLVGGADAIMTGLSCNSSLATVPVTLRCLRDKVGVTEKSARLAACVGTNLNNDGITLYEAMTALFLAQALGWDLGLQAQIGVLLASLMASVGIAGIPEAGLIVLPLVLTSAGLPETLVAAVIPLILPVDWLIARCRSAVNVMSDMLVAIMLDATRTAAEKERDAELDEVLALAGAAPPREPSETVAPVEVAPATASAPG
jgi:DAACS family dicarboxylate/amino acid:cation (Na+ or H+) symporter